MNERYRLIRLLGGGGMAEVYLAVALGAEGFEKPVAIKRMLPHLAQDESIARMFLTEAQLSTQLHHQNIVQVLDVQRGPQGLFLVMELVDGWDLAVVFDRCARVSQRIPGILAVYIAAQVANGLSHAYRRTLDGKPLIAAHRDISPSNILLSAEGEVKVADFGIARMASLPNLTAPGTFKGKIPFAAPEVIRGSPATPASDQFGLGVVLYMMLTGNHPFGHPDNLVLYSETLARAQPPPLPGVPPALVAIVHRTLAMQPESRFPSCEALAQALNIFLSKSGVPASGDGLAQFLRSLRLRPTPLQLMAMDPAPPGLKLPEPISLDLLKVSSSSPPGDPGEPSASDWTGDAGTVLSASGRLARSAASRPPEPAPGPAAPAASPAAPTEAQSGSVPLEDPAPFPLVTGGEALALEEVEARPAAEGEGLQLSEEGQQWLQRPEAREAPSVKDLAKLADPRRVHSRHRPSTFGDVVLAVGLTLAFYVVMGLAMSLGLVSGLSSRRSGLPASTPPQVEALLRKTDGTVREMLRKAGLPVKRQAESITHILRIESTPSGALVRINGEEKGETPIFEENTYPTGAKVEVKLSLPGYRAWTGTFTGGGDAAVEARLLKR